jgi:hypothetical protein
MARLGHEAPGMAMVYEEWAEERDRLPPTWGEGRQ